ncbi:MAG: beta-glycosidase [Candidatus Latescibacteria bacterium]|nr:beta-glycosidase [Candidatus Latescibacterota bacterium]
MSKNMLHTSLLPILSLFLSLSFFISPVYAQRTVIDLSKYDWGIFRDFHAEWIYDEIWLPPVQITKLPVNPPSCGWEALNHNIEKTVHVPATVEEHFWIDNENPTVAGGDYRGVSWWITTVTLGNELRGKRIFIDFESVHLRAEVFVNRRLTGYDTIGHTPFSVDITEAVRYGTINEIAIRITDPVGNFSWNDRQVLQWGNRDIPACHGFGGITGRIFLRAVDNVFIEDIYVENKPVIKEVDLHVAVQNFTGEMVKGNVEVTVYPWENQDDILWKKQFKRAVDSGKSEFVITIKSNKAKVWDIDKPYLYVAEVTFTPESLNFSDTHKQRFGFRWFDIGEKNGDQRFYLNGRRTVLRSGMSWGFWPVNGVYPTKEMAVRDVELAQQFGLNLMNFHRAIGQPPVMDAADERGFLCYEESGGYSCEGANQESQLWRDWRREKLLRMVKRDRSRPSLIIYNLQNRTPNEPEGEDVRNMREVHTLDPTRIITYMSGFWKPLPKEHPTKLFFRPNDFTEHYTGWFDMHMFSPAQSYTDACYNNPSDFTRYSDDIGEIVYWGEDGAINNPPQLQLIKDYHEVHGGYSGWIVGNFLEWYKSYDDFLYRSGFREFFPDVHAFTKSIGNVSLYYHGRVMENIRMGNVTDCYTINGWAANQFTNHCDIADLYRNPNGNPETLAQYCRPLYVAVKLRDKVVPAGSGVTADFYIINEANIKGKHDLSIVVEDEAHKIHSERTLLVTLQGGEEYGQLLVENITLKTGDTPGYYTVTAKLTNPKGEFVANGSDTIFSVALDGTDLSHKGAVVDTTGIINRMLKKTCGFTLPKLTEKTVDPDYIVIGPNDFRRANQISFILEHVLNGTTAIVIADTDRFADFISASNSNYYAVEYYGTYRMSRGNFIAGKHPLLDSLPQAQAFNWEYQIFNIYSGQNVYALRLFNGQTVVAAVSDHQKEVGAALAVIPYGRGKIILSTLNIIPFLDDDSPQSVVAKRLFINYLKY